MPARGSMEIKILPIRRAVAPDLFHCRHCRESRWQPGQGQDADPPGKAGRGRRGQVPEFPRAENRVRLWISTHGIRVSHQATWNKPVFQVYEGASISFEWTPILRAECDEAGIDYFTSPYDYEAVEHVAPFVPAFKIGSGEIDWIEALEHIAAKGSPWCWRPAPPTWAMCRRPCMRS